MGTSAASNPSEWFALISFYLVWTAFVYSSYDAPIGTLLSGEASRTVSAFLFLWVVGGIGLCVGFGIWVIGRYRVA